MVTPIAGIVLTILIGATNTVIDSYNWETRLENKTKMMNEAYVLAEVAGRAKDIFDFIVKSEKFKLDPLLQTKADEKIWQWLKEYQSVIQNDMQESDSRAIQAFYLTQKLSSQQFQMTLSNPADGSKAIMELTDELTLSGLTENSIKKSLIIKQKLIRLSANMPTYIQLYPNAWALNCLSATILGFPIALLLSVLIFVFRVHEDIVLPELKLKQRPFPCE